MKHNGKYHPKTVDELIISDPETHKRIREYASGARSDNLILHGPRGTGKSTTAEVVTKARCDDFNPFPPLHGADFQTEDFDKILAEWSWQRCNGVEHPTTVIDEIDQMSPLDQQRMRSFVERHTWGSIIGTTNNPHKIDGPLFDRFDAVEIPVIDIEAWTKRACDIFAAEGVDYTADKAREIVSTSNGSIRDTMRAIDDYLIAKRNAEQSV